MALIPAASYGLSLAAANLPVRAGQRILLLEDQFPSNVYAWRDLAQRMGAEVETVPRPADFDWTAALLARIDERTAIVAVPHCHWTDGSRIDLVAVGGRARAVGAAHLIGLRSERPLLADLPARLAAANVYVSVRGTSIRVSPHLYNSAADVDRLFEVIASAL